VKTFKILLLLLLPFSNFYGQEELIVEDPSLYADPSLETQFAFVQELLYTAGYVPEEIRVYQTLPNHAHVYQVKLDSVQGGFVFVRWDKNKKEHFVSNKMIDPGLYYNLNAAREIMRKQTDKASFGSEDISLQAGDQYKISGEDIEGLRGAFDKKLEIQKEVQQNMHQKQLDKAQRKVERKKSKN
jgi:hypothetical protein